MESRANKATLTVEHSGPIGVSGLSKICPAAALFSQLPAVGRGGLEADRTVCRNVDHVVSNPRHAVIKFGE